jgi:competence protein ComEA
MDARDPSNDAGSIPTLATSLAPTPAGQPGLGGGPNGTPAGQSGFPGRILARLRESVWGPVVLRVASVSAGMLGLAAIGVASTLAGAGVSVSRASPSTSASTWIAPDRAAPHDSAHPGPTASAAPAPGTTSDGANAIAPGDAANGVTPDGRVVLNAASLEQLTKLPRVGAKRAQAILDLRKRLGRFRQPTDLLRVRGIGRKTLQLMLPHLVVDAEVTAPKR